jgi:hypothetical protein
MTRNYNEIEEARFNQLYAEIKKGSYRYMGRGSGRVVYDLGNGRVVKAARNMKGIAQNMEEHRISSADDSGLFAKVYETSGDYRLLIMDKADRIRNVSYIWNYFQAKSGREFYQVKKIRDISEKYGLLIRDLGRAANWGHIGGRPVIVDYGFTQKVRKRYYRAALIGPKRKQQNKKYRFFPFSRNGS